MKNKLLILLSILLFLGCRTSFHKEIKSEEIIEIQVIWEPRNDLRDSDLVITHKGSSYINRFISILKKSKRYNRWKVPKVALAQGRFQIKLFYIDESVGVFKVDHGNYIFSKETMNVYKNEDILLYLDGLLFYELSDLGIKLQ